MTSAPSLSNAMTDLSLQASGGMIGPVTAKIAGRRFDVLTCPGWGPRDGAEGWLPMIRDMCGDFICVPYGAPEPGVRPAGRLGRRRRRVDG